MPSHMRLPHRSAEQGEKSPRAARHLGGLGPQTPISRRTALELGLLALTGAAGALAVVRGCATDAPDATSSDATSDLVICREAACLDGDGVYYVRFGDGTIAATDTSVSAYFALYSNGGVNQAGIRYLGVWEGEVFFGDAPSQALLAVPVTGGEPRTVLAAASEGSLVMPRFIDRGTVYASMLDMQSMASELWSVRTDGTAKDRLFSLPQGFYLGGVDLEAERAYYAGINDAGEREIRSADLDGGDERVVFAMEGVASEDADLCWGLADGCVIVDAQNVAERSDRLLSISPDGSDQQLICDFASRNLEFDLCGDSLFMLDRDTLDLMAVSLDGQMTTLCQIPRTDGATTAALLEAGRGTAFVTTVTPDADAASVYRTYMVDAAEPEPLLLP